uniref:Ribosomal RNA small subunit methyltransferase I n=1 Tax=Thermorudis peleae TaxID=1382356 RepID=A0A831WYK6_9BACT
MGTLYLVATPIGNLEDITLRALRTLREVPLIAAEDTRHARKLLAHYGIETKLVSFHERSPPARVAELMEALERHDVAVISDAGMPGISDPGLVLVREAAARGFDVVPVPGPSAVTAAVAVSGLVEDGFLFLGFLPRRASERRRQLESLAGLPFPLVLYEAPHRLRETLRDLEATLGDRPLAICRELTKLHEEVSHLTIGEALRRYEAEAPRGEFVLVVGAPESPQLPPSEAELMALLEEQLAAGRSVSAAAREVARATGASRQAVYRLALNLRGRHATGPPGVSAGDARP